MRTHDTIVVFSSCVALAVKHMSVYIITCAWNYLSLSKNQNVGKRRLTWAWRTHEYRGESWGPFHFPIAQTSRWFHIGMSMQELKLNYLNRASCIVVVQGSKTHKLQPQIPSFESQGGKKAVMRASTHFLQCCLLNVDFFFWVQSSVGFNCVDLISSVKKSVQQWHWSLWLGVP